MMQQKGVYSVRRLEGILEYYDPDHPVNSLQELLRYLGFFEHQCLYRGEFVNGLKEFGSLGLKKYVYAYYFKPEVAYYRQGMYLALHSYIRLLYKNFPDAPKQDKLFIAAGPDEFSFFQPWYEKAGFMRLFRVNIPISAGVNHLRFLESLKAEGTTPYSYMVKLLEAFLHNREDEFIYGGIE